MSRRTRVLPALPVLTLALFAVACGDETTGPATFINVGLQNSGTEPMTIDIAGGADGTRTVTAPPGYTSTEIRGTSGNRLTFMATAGTRTGEQVCTATNEIVGTSTYGQVNFVPGGTSVILVECATGWVESD